MCGQQRNKPKLVVGIVIDQMKYEYLYRFQDNYTENGFKRLINEGFNVKNLNYNYIPTETGPGHASIYTGTTPANHGIVSNDWYDRDTKSMVYCAEDKDAVLVDNNGIENNNFQFSRSPKNNLTSTITDELKLFSNKRSKVIGISLKDRGAILPAGHMADYAFWYDNKNGHFITSSFYNDKLPDWVKEFNNRHLADSLLEKKWEPLLAIEKYLNSNPDDAPLECIYVGKTKSIFPYDLSALKKENGGYQLLMQTPFGNSLLTQFAKATILGESMGKQSDIDFLTISYSSTDKVAHDFGIRSKELEDTYVRLDREIEELLNYLDNYIGKGNYLLFLTADHAASDNPDFLKSVKLPGKFFDPKKIEATLNQKLSVEFGRNDYISYMDNTQIFVNSHNIPKKDIIGKLQEYLLEVDGVREVFAPTLKDQCYFNSTIGNFVINSYNSERSGDIIYQMYPEWMAKRNYGTSHGTSYNSDTHVPLLWFGWNIPKGETMKYHEITQIAPTLSFLLNIPLPNSANSNPIEEIFNQKQQKSK
tara:strand:+ start:2899 stop:4497 length:1599 start_codon:yes stop_codon:yes gene_type:complete